MDRRPVICVACTADAERLALKNGTSVCELFERFSASPSSSSNITFRSVSRHFSLPNGLAVRFVNARDTRPTPPDVADRELTAAMKPLQGETTDLKEAERSSGSQRWLERWRVALERSLQQTEFESLDCPAVVVLACSSAEPAGVAQALEELSSMSQHLASGFRDGHYDERATPRQVVVLHDVAEAAAEPRVALAAAREALKGRGQIVARLLPMNSIGISAADFFDSAPAGALTSEDKDELRRFNAELLRGGVVPALERRVASLHLNVQNSRKGVRNVLKSWLRRPKEEIKPVVVQDKTVTPVMYQHETIEAQIRLLADTCFCVSDYESALQMYRLVRDDFKSDRALLHLGSTNEMIARCLHALGNMSSNDGAAHLMDPRVARREAIVAADAATAALVTAAEEARASQRERPQVGTVASRLLTRAALVAADSHTELLPQPGTKPAEAAAEVLVGAAQFETNLCAAALYELAALSYRKGGLKRKSALHLVMAGHRYRACGQEAQALECYLSSQKIYAIRSKSGWARIEEHVDAALTRQLETLGHHALSLECIMRTVASAQPASAEKHAALLRDFLKSCVLHQSALKEAAASLLTAANPGNDLLAFNDGAVVLQGLPLPLVVCDSVTIRTNDEPNDEEDEQWWSRDLLGKLEVECAAEAGWDGVDGDDLFSRCVAAQVAAESSNTDATARLRKATTTAAAAAAASKQLTQSSSSKSLLPTAMGLASQASSAAKRAALAKARLAVWPRSVARAEAVHVDVIFKNTLGVPLNLSEVHLVCNMTVNEDLAGQSMRSSTSGTAPSDTDDAFLKELHDLANDDAASLSHLTEMLKAVTVPAGGSIVVRLRCGAAASCGTLRLVGVRWRLGAEGPWAAKAFQRSGPRLRRTRFERATGARCEDASLALHVVGDVPRLQVKLVIDEVDTSSANKGLTTLHGEVKRGRLELVNLGRSTATNIRLRCSSAWLAVGTSSKMSSVEATAVGASGSTWRAATEDGTDVELAPFGGKVILPVLLRAQGGGGKSSLKIVVRYKKQQAALVIDRPRVWPPVNKSDPEAEDCVQRCLRERQRQPALPEEAPVVRCVSLALDVTVLPCLEVLHTANLLRISDSNVATLPAVLTNYRSDGAVKKRDIQVQSIQAVTTEPTSVALGSVVVGWQEQYTLHLEVAKEQAGEPAGEHFELLCVEQAAERFNSAVSALRLMKKKKKKKKKQRGGEDGLRSVSSIRRDRAQGLQESVEIKKKSSKPLSKNFLLDADRDAARLSSFVVKWTCAEEPLRSGQHHLARLSVRPESQPVTIALEYAPVLRFDFSKNTIAATDVLVRVWNNDPASLPLELSAADDEFGDVTWVGATRKCLSGGWEGALTVRLRAAFARPGTFDLGLLQVARPDGPVQHFDAQYLITVLDTASIKEHDR